MNKFLTNVHSKHVLYSATTVQEQSVGSWTSLGAQKSRRSLIGPSWAGAKQSARGAGHLTLRQQRWTKNNELPYLILIVDQSSICGFKDEGDEFCWFTKFSINWFCDSPGIQMHRNPPLSSIQVPWFWQGFVSHSLMLISHRRPLNPFGQSHRYDPGSLTQVPPCSQGDPNK